VSGVQPAGSRRRPHGRGLGFRRRRPVVGLGARTPTVGRRHPANRARSFMGGGGVAAWRRRPGELRRAPRPRRLTRRPA